ncbi:unnamed protein product, partial [Sphacelaria rigidula]
MIDMGEYGRDTLNDNGLHLLTCTAKHETAITNTLYTTPTSGKRSAAYTHEGPKGKHRWRLDYIRVRQQDLRRV